jgi:hypothetical protein
MSNTTTGWPGKGDYVVATRGGSAWFVAGNGRHQYEAGHELIVTSTRSRGLGRVNVRSTRGGPVFAIEVDRIRRVSRMVGEIPEGSIPPEDPRIAWLFEDAGRMADRLGLCADYDRLCDALGVPGRVRTFTISIMSGEGIEVSAKVEARSKRLAEQAVRDQLARSIAPAPMVLEAARA